MNRVLPPIPLQELDEVLDPWEAVWARLKGKTVFITGGTGTLGTWLLELFCRANARWQLGASVRLLSRRPEAFRNRSPHLSEYSAVTLVEGDIRTFASLSRSVDYVIHGATDSSGALAYEDILEYLDSMVVGTRHLLQRALEAGSQRVLYLSSGAVYGTQPPDLEGLPEEWEGAPDPLNPGTRYAQGKRMGEHLCMVYRHQFGLDSVVARGFALVGPHLPLDAHFAIGNFIRDVLRGEPIEVQGDGSPIRSYLYLADYAMACWLVLLAGESGRAYNIGSSEAIGIADLAHLVARQANQEVIIRGRPLAGTRAGRYVPSVHRIRGELGFQAKVDLRSSIQRTMDWYKL